MLLILPQRKVSNQNTHDNLNIFKRLLHFFDTIKVGSLKND